MSGLLVEVGKEPEGISEALVAELAPVSANVDSLQQETSLKTS